jgi:hypothetical protein
MKKTILSAVLVLLATSAFAAAAPSQPALNCPADSALAQALGLVPAAASPQAMGGGSPIGEMPVGGCQLTSCTQANQQCRQVDCPGCKVFFSCDPADPCGYSCTCHNCIN